ncbi:fibronectin type III domain-containing protein [Aquimarina pacifica]|uniref:fibronectin type III domain-containing protein n=1 Tax=Aquimarina pacifica TaxID=1296415 RepID=UPI00046F9196|nr:zinc-dependent metalloprotease family protein [Aquimarina pacifica]
MTKSTGIFKTIFCFVFLFLSNNVQSQIWTPVAQNKMNDKTKEYRNTTPSNYLLFSLNSVELENILKNTPSRKQQKTSTTIIELPLSNGVLKKFEILEASTLEEGLSERFPNIKSYIGHGVDDPSSIARISISKVGLHAMISSGNHETMYIDPYTKDKKEYIIYSKSDLPRDANNFECLVENTPELNISQKISNSYKNANDGQLRTFRLAIACSGEYSQYHLSNQGISASASDQVKKEAVLSAMNTTMTRVNGIFERDLAVTMVIVNNNTDIIFLDSNTDNLSNSDAYSLINESQTVCDAYIGSNNYDIGHTFSTGGGGLAQLRSPCTSSKARGITGSSNPIGDSYDVDYVAHEMGHQFGANHTQNNNCNRSSASAEPGSASTIMGYAGICNPNVQNNSDDYFHAISIQEMWANISSGSGTCAAQSSTGNSAPTANAGSNYTIPASTPFILKGNATDSNSNDTLTYCWEQMDTETATMPPSSSSASGPAFRSLPPTTSPDRYMPDLSTVINGLTSSTWEVVPSVSRTMDFRLTVRDNSSGGGSTASDDITISVAGSAGPFVVNSPNSNVSWQVGSTQTVTWDVAGTTGNGINADTVDILLSTDGGNTYSTTIMTATSNDGAQNIIVPNAVGTQNRIMVRGSDHIFYDISNDDFEITQGTADLQAPSVPQGVTTSNITQTSVDIDWNASTDNIGVTGYDIYQGNTIIATVTSTSYQVTGLLPDTNYSFSIVAFDASNNESDNSNAIGVTTLSEPDTQAPSTPTEVTSSAITQTSVFLDWNASTDNIGVTGYNIYLANILIATVSSTSYQVMGLLSSTNYSFSITAFDANDNESDNSNAVTITTLSEPDTEEPTMPTELLTSNSTQTSITITWNASTDNVGVTGYDIYLENNIIATVTSTSYQVTGLLPDTNYSFNITAFDAAGNQSDEATLDTATLPPNNTCQGGITSFPYTEGFENTLENWIQDSENDIDWQIYSGATPSRNTGPYGSDEGDYYIYVEASGNNRGYPNKNAIISSPCIDLTTLSSAYFVFSYHMRGNTMGSLDLEISTNEGNSWTSIFNKSGNQGDEWVEASLDLSPYTGNSIQLRFNAITGVRSRSDIAIDNIRLIESVIEECSDVNLTINLDNYPEETSWTITNNEQIVASGGTYPNQPDGSTVVITECLDPGIYTFTLYDSYGDGICCGYGNGSYTLSSNGTTLISGGVFGSSESTTFTIGDGIKELAVNNIVTTEASKISIFPNPVKNNEVLNVIVSSENTEYNVFDMLGRIVLKGTLTTQKSINTKNLPSGMYALKLTVEKNYKSRVIRFIKE